MSSYDFSTLYTTLPHNLIKDKLIDLIERTFQRESSPYLACNDRNDFLTSENPKKYHAWSCQNVCDTLTFLLDNFFLFDLAPSCIDKVSKGAKISNRYNQAPHLTQDTNGKVTNSQQTPQTRAKRSALSQQVLGFLWAIIVLRWLQIYSCLVMRDFMMSLSDDKQAYVIDAFNTTFRYFDDISNINNVYFDNVVSQIYPSELQLNKANTSDTEATFLDLHLSISNDIDSTKIYDKRDDFYFEIVCFTFLDGDVPCSTSYGVYISQLIRFARASSYVADFNTRNNLLTQKLL